MSGIAKVLTEGRRWQVFPSIVDVRLLDGCAVLEGTGGKITVVFAPGEWLQVSYEPCSPANTEAE